MQSLQQALEAAWLVVPDGAPVAWLLRRTGAKQARRVAGPDLMLGVLETGRSVGLRHFLFGSTPQVLGALTRELQQKVPGVQIVGAYSPEPREEDSPEALSSIGPRDLTSCGSRSVRHDKNFGCTATQAKSTRSGSGWGPPSTSTLGPSRARRNGLRGQASSGCIDSFPSLPGSGLGTCRRTRRSFCWPVGKCSGEMGAKNSSESTTSDLANAERALGHSLELLGCSRAGGHPGRIDSSNRPPRRTKSVRTVRNGAGSGRRLWLLHAFCCSSGLASPYPPRPRRPSGQLLRSH